MNKFSNILLICLSFNLLVSADISIVNEESFLPNDSKELYIDLIKRVVANTIYEDSSFQGPFSYEVRKSGGDHPLIAHTMIGIERLNNIHYCMKEILENHIPGDCVETGVWRGGATILMRAILKVYGDTSRKIWAVDSFEGLPHPDLLNYPEDSWYDFSEMSQLVVSLNQVQDNFRKYGLLDSQVVFLKGLFKNTLPNMPVEQISLLRLDGDYYESTIQALRSLYPKLSIGGYLIIDDYGWVPPCKKAVEDYRIEQSISDEILQIDSAGIYWKKTK